MPRFENPSYSKPLEGASNSVPGSLEQNGRPEVGRAGEIDRTILVDGKIRGLERSRLSLSEFSQAPSFKECFFETESGNIYGIFKQHPDLILADARSNAGQGGQSRGALLSEDSEELQVGQPLRYGKGSTSPITQIIVVTDAHLLSGGADRALSQAVAQEETEGRMSDLRRRFHEIVASS